MAGGQRGLAGQRGDRRRPGRREPHAGLQGGQGLLLEPIKDFLLNVGYLASGGSLESLAGRYPSGTDGLRVTEVACAVERSIRENRAVSIAEVRGEGR